MPINPDDSTPLQLSLTGQTGWLNLTADLEDKLSPHLYLSRRRLHDSWLSHNLLTAHPPDTGVVAGDPSTRRAFSPSGWREWAMTLDEPALTTVAASFTIWHLLFVRLVVVYSISVLGKYQWLVRCIAFPLGSKQVIHAPARRLRTSLSRRTRPNNCGGFFYNLLQLGINYLIVSSWSRFIPKVLENHQWLVRYIACLLQPGR